MGWEWQQRYPSEKTLQQRLGVTRDEARQLRDAMHKRRGLSRANSILRAYGIETIYLPDGCQNRCEEPEHTIAYVNRGDTYSTTLLKVDGRYVVGDWGSYVEKGGTHDSPACPWCGSLRQPVPNDDDPDEHRRRRNPAKCPECDGVGGWVDWGLFELAIAPDQ